MHMYGFAFFGNSTLGFHQQGEVSNQRHKSVGVKKCLLCWKLGGWFCLCWDIGLRAQAIFILKNMPKEVSKSSEKWIESPRQALLNAKQFAQMNSCGRLRRSDRFIPGLRCRTKRINSILKITNLQRTSFDSHHIVFCISDFRGTVISLWCLWAKMLWTHNFKLFCFVLMFVQQVTGGKHKEFLFFPATRLFA